ncbi:hypothetical protein XBKB1_1340002 [Xenorhabdus bovienii str. kraussei Becker Underwood]|uniref:Uncharacterized protein n=1 Tax=Xenorhabdus bovienii str. kraussei Becker Underwood TaxID=1398204 RepID=A0A077PP68_XENBV|nr:hypothetical protein XBKB1_1340002 [Xenorhabdus bovienii str. kraussei Becker Underwood]
MSTTNLFKTQINHNDLNLIDFYEGVKKPATSWLFEIKTYFVIHIFA